MRAVSDGGGILTKIGVGATALAALATTAWTSVLLTPMSSTRSIGGTPSTSLWNARKQCEAEGGTGSRAGLGGRTALEACVWMQGEGRPPCR